MAAASVRGDAVSYPLVIYAMEGMGDAVFQRPLVRYYAERRGTVYLRTSWPELFKDIPGIRFIHPESTDLRTQNINAARRPDSFWARPPLTAERIRARYALTTPGETILSELKRCYGVPGAAPMKMDLPDFGHPPVRYKRYAVIRPVTLRKEWLNPARSPRPEYIAQAADILHAQGYRVVSVAHVEAEKNQEWLEGPEPFADRAYHQGELDVRQLGALVQHADVVVGGVGWIVPFSIAARTPAVFIAGGQGGYNAPGIVTDRRHMDLTRIRWVMPDRYCADCKKRLHACRKEISSFEEKFTAALHGVTSPREAVA